MRLIVYVTLCLLVVLCAGLMIGSGNDLRAQAAPNGSEFSQTSRKLSDILGLPPEDVIPALVRAIRTDSSFQDGNWKHHAYFVLLNHGGARHAQAIRQFIEGLSDPDVSCLCLYALGTVPERHRAAVIPALSEYLSYFVKGRRLPCNDPKTLFEAIGNLGGSVRQLARPVQQVVSDTTLPVETRGLAARALPRVIGIQDHIELIKAHPRGDPVGSQLMLHALLLEGEREGWTDLSNRRTRQAMEELILDLLNVRKVRNFEERLKLKPDAPELQKEVRALKGRMEYGDVLTSSIIRLQRSQAPELVAAWVRALQPISTDDPSMTVRLDASTRLVDARKQLSYLGY